MIAIDIQGLSKRFGDSLVLDQIDLRVEPGEMFFLLGASGCGKTTLLRHLAGFYYPDEGRILFDGQDVSRLPPHRRGTGMVFQSYALWPHLSVAGNVAFGLEELRRPRLEIWRRVEEALASVGMSAFADRKINQLSGGQQQRVALARALVIRPRCLLLDEPLSNLDAKLRLQMRSEIRRACKESGVTAIYVTHDQKEALSIADRLAILDRGQIAQCGNPREVYRRPHSRAVADFIGDSNFIDGHLLAPGPTPGSFRVGTALGEFTGYKSDPGWMPQAGEAVILLVRPESWKFFGVGGGIGATANRNSVAGRVTRSVYLGDTAEHEFRPRADGSAAFKVSEMNPRLEAVAGDGEIWAHAAPEDVVLLSH